MFQTAIAIIKKFCKENPSERLGYQKDGILDIRKHRYDGALFFLCGKFVGSTERLSNFPSCYRWYQGFDWDGLENRTLAPPIMPKV